MPGKDIYLVVGNDFEPRDATHIALGAFEEFDDAWSFVETRIKSGGGKLSMTKREAIDELRIPGGGPVLVASENIDYEDEEYRQFWIIESSIGSWEYV